MLSHSDVSHSLPPSRTGLVALSLALALGVPSALVAQAAPPNLTLPIYRGTNLDEIFAFDLADGRGTRYDSLDRDDVSRGRLENNLFGVIGRATDQAARVGEMLAGPVRDSSGTTQAALVVETSTGYPLYFERLGRSDQIGEAITFLGRPFEPLRSPDGNFALLMRRDDSGQTVGAWLYHAGSGRAIHIGGVDELVIDPDLTTTEDLPSRPGPIAAAPIVRDEQSVSYLVVDANGGLFFLDVRGTRLVARDAGVSIADAFTAETTQPTPRRFSIVSLENGDSTTVAALVVDAATGGMGLLLVPGGGLADGTPRLQKLPRDVYGAIAGGIVAETPRVFELVPAHSSSGTRGVWLFDSLTGGLLLIDRPDDPDSLSIVRPLIER